MPITRKKKKKAPPAKRCKVVRDKRTGRRKKVCRKPPRRPAAAPVPKPLPGLPVPSAAAPAVVVPAGYTAPAPVAVEDVPPGRPAPAPDPGPAPQPPAKPAPTPEPQPQPKPQPPADPAPTPVADAFGRREAERLLWRAGFGPRPGDVERVAALGLQGAVRELTRPEGAPTLTGAAPRDEDGNPLDPYNAWGHDHLWWLDRMVRSDQQLVERMALIWHDWFATTEDDVDERFMLEQNELFRANALGSFETLALEVTRGPAMLLFLNGIDNRRGRPNENYARELMELFTLGADRGAYTEDDVRELARALTGWRADWNDDEGFVNFRFDPNRHDAGTKTLWAGSPHARSGAFGWQDAVRLCLDHPMHAEFFVRKLWSYFVPTPPDDATRAALEATYVQSGFQIRPIVEAILAHPDLYAPNAPMVKPPAVYNAGLLRLRERPIDTAAWTWLGMRAGQVLFRPPNVSGWNDAGWLDTSTINGRWYLAYHVIHPEHIGWNAWSATETPAEAVEAALAFWHHPTLTPETRAELLRFAEAAVPPTLASWEQGPRRGARQNALRHLVAVCPDFQTS